MLAIAAASAWSKSFLRWSTFVILIVFISSCTATRFIPEDKLLLRKATVELDSKPLNFEKADLEYLIALKPNNKFSNL